MVKKPFFSFLLFIIPFISNSQDTTSKIKISEINLQTGILFYNDKYGSVNEFIALSPGTSLLKTDFSNYSKYSYQGVRSSNYYNLNVGLQLKKHPNSILRMGISHMQVQNIKGFLRLEERTPYDTLTSSQTGNQTFVDSIDNNWYTMYYTSNQLRLNASLLFYSESQSRWTVYGGFGVSLGMSFKSQTKISYTENLTTSNAEYDPISKSQKEEFRSKTIYNVSVFIPLGIDFRLGKKTGLFNRIHTYFEIKPAYTISSIPGVKTFSTFEFMYGLGLRYTL